MTEVLSRDDLSGLSSAELKAELAKALSVTAHGLARAATLWSELHRRGESLPELRSGLATWLPRIARGDLAPEAVVAFAGQRMLLQRMMGMPLDEQRKFAAGEEITVAAINDRGEIVGEDKPLARLNSREILLAIGDAGSIRPLHEQTKTLGRSITKTRRRTHSGNSTATIRADRQSGLLQIGRSRVEPTDLANALRALGWRMERIESGAAD